MSIATIETQVVVVSDTQVNVITAGVQGAAGSGLPVIFALTDAATIATNAALGDIFTVTLAASRTMVNPTNPIDGKRITYRITQGSGGSKLITWGSDFRFSGGTAPTLTTAAGKTDYIGFIYNASAGKWDCVADRLNF